MAQESAARERNREIEGTEKSELKLEDGPPAPEKCIPGPVKFQQMISGWGNGICQHP